MSSQIHGVQAVIRELHKVEDHAYHHITARMDRLALKVQNQAKTNRPWTDRTGNARRSIMGHASRESLYHWAATLAIGVYYGKYLELSNGGKYRIIRPTVDSNRSTLMDVPKGALKS